MTEEGPVIELHSGSNIIEMYADYFLAMIPKDEAVEVSNNA